MAKVYEDIAHSKDAIDIRLSKILRDKFLIKTAQALDESYNTDKQSDSGGKKRRRKAIYSLMDAREDDSLP